MIVTPVDLSTGDHMVVEHVVEGRGIVGIHVHVLVAAREDDLGS